MVGRSGRLELANLDLLDFQILWLDVYGPDPRSPTHVVGTEDIRRYDLTAAIEAAAQKLLRGRGKAASARGFVVRRKPPAPDYWNMTDDELRDAWQEVDGANYVDDPTGEKIEKLNYVEDAILQRINAPLDASGDEPVWQEKIRAFGLRKEEGEDG